MNDLRERVARACLVRGPVTLRSGEQSDVYVDTWRLLCEHGLRAEVAVWLGSLVPRRSRVAGPELGGAILGVLVADHEALPLLVVRRAVKTCGTGNRIEGTYQAGDTAVLVEDVLTTGQTALDAITVLREAGLVVDTCVAVIDRRVGATELLAAHGVEVRALWTLDELLADAPEEAPTTGPGGD